MDRFGNLNAINLRIISALEAVVDLALSSTMAAPLLLVPPTDPAGSPRPASAGRPL